MIDALIKRVSALGEKGATCSCFEIDQEMDAILLITGLSNRH
jgi:hypothetical protein